MFTIIIGIILFVVAVAAFYYSLPREGKVARFVGTQSEGYVVVVMLAAGAMGTILAVSGLLKM